jgi:hypothetical protein
MFWTCLDDLGWTDGGGGGSSTFGCASHLHHSLSFGVPLAGASVVCKDVPDDLIELQGNRIMVPARKLSRFAVVLTG